MRGWSRRRPVGREDGEYIVARCPRDVLVSTPQSLWEEDRANVESFGFTLGRRVTPAETRNRTRRLAKLPGRVAREAALDERDRAIVRESEAERTYEAIGQEHGISDQRVRQIVDRERKLAARFRSGSPLSARPGWW
ncbi:MAG TPA: sigma factor-like helix-turn-helix DNA-binding protein [Solirubrobacteraceae bacterium]